MQIKYLTVKSVEYVPIRFNFLCLFNGIKIQYSVLFILILLIFNIEVNIEYILEVEFEGRQILIF